MNKEYYEKNKAKWREYYATRRRKAPLYAAWRSMLVRTGKIKGAKPHEVKDYINRGIGICDEWMVYERFEKWAFDNGWRRGLVIDRINNDDGYHPSNCRIVTPSENQRNRRNTWMCVYNGRVMTLIAAWEMSGSKVCYKNVLNRIKRGWKLERAFGTEGE